LHTSANGGPAGAITVNNAIHVWISPGTIPTTYTLTATHINPYTTSIFDEVNVTIFKINDLFPSSLVASLSVNPPPFTPEMPWTFDVKRSIQEGQVVVDKHAVIFYKDAIDSNFNVKDFTIQLAARLANDIFDAYRLHFMLNKLWVKTKGPNSGYFTTQNYFTETFYNPKQGGVYHFTFYCDYMLPSECNVVLPLAGASVDVIVEADLARADTFAQRVRERYNPRQRNDPFNGLRWFNNDGAGDYRGRPDNPNSQTVWYYNQVHDDTWLGSVATWKGIPIRTAKMSNFMVAYASERIGVTKSAQWLASIFIGNLNDDAAEMSWAAGKAVAQNPSSYNTVVYELVRNAWNKSCVKNQLLWPNLAPATNYVVPAMMGLPNSQFTSPDFLYMDNP